MRFLSTRGPSLVFRAATARVCAPALSRRPLCTVPITFVEDGEEIKVDAEIGKTLLEVAHDNDITSRVHAMAHLRARLAT